MIVIVGVIASPADFSPVGDDLVFEASSLLKAVPGGWRRPLSTQQRGGYRF